MSVYHILVNMSTPHVSKSSSSRSSATPTLVLGATGKTGRRVADRLNKQGLPIRLGSRSAEPRFDWEDSQTWGRALDGVGAVYISFQPDLAVPGAVDAVRSLAEQALERGVLRMVLLSGRGEEEALRAEQAIQDSGADWTILRSSWFAQNFSESFLLDAILSGEVALPVGEVPEPFIDTEDIADAAVAALTDDKHIGQIYEVTGPRLLTFREAVDEIAEASGRAIRFQQIPAKQYAEALNQYGLPEGFVSLLMYLFTTVLDGRNAHATDGVQRALNRQPNDFANYARATSATWKP
jgi:uncharacterized protein YbjT (DUF2867 family)